MSVFSIKLDNFTGPLDLLLYLISKSKIDIKDIFLSKITDQFIGIVYSSENVDMEYMGDFLSMAARLIEIKSKALLPDVDEDLENDKQTLIFQIEEYKRIKSIIPKLLELETSSLMYLEKLPEETFDIVSTVVLKEHSSVSLSNAMFRILDRKIFRFEKEKYKNTINSLRIEQISIKQGIANILNSISFNFQEFHNFINFYDREHYATYFIAMLELLKQGKIVAYQDGIFKEILLKKENNNG